MSSVTSGRRPRRQRTLVQKLASIVLGFESVVVFLAGLTVFGLKALPAGVPLWFGIAGGAIMGVSCIIVAGAIVRPWAITAGWVLQALIALSAILVPAILLVVLIFGGMWAYATIMGARLDARQSSPTETSTESE